MPELPYGTTDEMEGGCPEVSKTSNPYFCPGMPVGSETSVVSSTSGPAGTQNSTSSVSRLAVVKAMLLGDSGRHWLPSSIVSYAREQYSPSQR